MVTEPRERGADLARFATVLVVEDEPMIRLSIVECLRDHSFIVLEAEHGEQAKQLFQGGATIDVVFTDVQMPGSIDGLDLARWLRANHPHVDILITSGVAEKTNSAAEVCAAASVFAKPYDHDAVAARISALRN